MATDPKEEQYRSNLITSFYAKTLAEVAQERDYPRGPLGVISVPPDDAEDYYEEVQRRIKAFTEKMDTPAPVIIQVPQKRNEPKRPQPKIPTAEERWIGITSREILLKASEIANGVMEDNSDKPLGDLYGLSHTVRDACRNLSKRIIECPRPSTSSIC